MTDTLIAQAPLVDQRNQDDETDGEGNLVTSAETARATGRVRLTFSDDSVRARIEE